VLLFNKYYKTLKKMKIRFGEVSHKTETQKLRQEVNVPATNSKLPAELPVLFCCIGV
jgi:hypothetical protein